jgi:hypothetical protein
VVLEHLEKSAVSVHVPFMASATGIPERHPNTIGRSEEEPLLGGAGDASQEDGKPLWYNLGLGKRNSAC